MFRTLSVKTKLILALSVIMLVAVAVISSVNYVVSRDAVRKELLTSSLPLTRDNIFSELHRTLMQPLSLSSLMASDTFLIDWSIEGEQDKTKIQKYLAEVRDKYGYLTAFFVSEGTGNYYHPDGVLKRISRMDLHDVWYYEFVARGVEYDLDVDTSEVADGALTLFINYKVRGYDGELLGVAGIGIRLDWVMGILSSFEEKYGRRVSLVDRFGTVQVHSDEQLVETANIKAMPGIKRVADKVLGLRDEPDSFQYQLDGGMILLSARYIPEFDWLLLVEQDEARALKSVRRILLVTLAGGFIAWLVIIGVTTMAVNYFQGRLEIMAVTDPLTGVANRREFEARFDRAASRQSRFGEVFCVLLFDLDRFKQVNDTKGHLEGDRVLVAVSGAIRDTIRPDDLLARWGGDEFIVLARGEAEECVSLAHRIRMTLHENAGVDASCGVARHLPGEDLDATTARADKAVYRAKAAGGGCVDIES